MLQGRLFSYADTYRHRLGANHLQLPVNCPYRVQAKNYQRDGPMNFTDNQGGAQNYFPNSFGGPTENARVRTLVPPFKVSEDVHRYQTNEDNFSQLAIFYNRVLDAAARQRLIDNIAGHMQNASPFIQERVVKNFAQVNTEFGAILAEILNLKNSANL